MRPRAGLRAAVCAFGVAAALVSAVGPPARESPAEAAHEDDRPGEVWVSASVVTSETTWQWEHVNLWTCWPGPLCNDSAGIGSGTAGVNASETTDCQPRAANEGAAERRGCEGHNAGGSGWAFVGHVMCVVGGVRVHHNQTGWEARCAADGAEKQTGKQVDGTAVYSCPVVGAVSAPAHCGDWSECTGNTVPNSTKTACSPCGANERPSADGETCEIQDCPDTADGQSQHRHGAGACEPDHPPRNGPDCETGLTSDVTVTWTYHDASGNNATGSKICGPIGGGGGGGGTSSRADDRCARNDRIYPYGKYWNFRRLIGAVSSEVVNAERVPTPTPLARAGNGWPWHLAARPSGGLALAPGGDLAVELWRSDYTGADKPGVYWQSSTGGGIQRQALEVATVGGSVVWAACGTVTIAASGSGWRLTNLALSDPEAATSGTGLGRFSWQGVTVADRSQPAGVATWQEWTITAIIHSNVKAPWPTCFRWRIQRRAETAADGYVAGVRPSGNASERACQWKVKVWGAIPVEVTACAGTPAHDHDPGDDEPFGPGDTIKGPHRHCAMPGV